MREWQFINWSPQTTPYYRVPPPVHQILTIDYLWNQANLTIRIQIEKLLKHAHPLFIMCIFLLYSASRPHIVYIRPHIVYNLGLLLCLNPYLLYLFGHFSIDNESIMWYNCLMVDVNVANIDQQALAIAEDLAIKRELAKYVPSEMSLIYKRLTKEERYFVSLYLETFDGLSACKSAYGISDDMIARMKYNKLIAKESVSKAVELLLEDAMGDKKIKFEVFKLGKTCFDPMVRFKSLELMARINNMLDGENKTQVTIDLGSALKSAYEDMKRRERIESDVPKVEIDNGVQEKEEVTDVEVVSVDTPKGVS